MASRRAEQSTTRSERERNASADRLANLAMDGETVVGPQSSVVSPQAPVGSPRAPAISQKSSADAFTPVERAVRLFVYRHFVETARAPDLGAVAASIRENERTVLAALRKLVAAHALVMAPASTTIWMAHPFSAVPTAYPVMTRGRTYWANCAWDAAAIMALLGGGETRTRCPDCGAQLTMAVRDDRINGGGVVHYAVPPRKFWDNVAYT